MGLESCHPSGAYNFEVVSIIFWKVCAPLFSDTLYQSQFQCYIRVLYGWSCSDMTVIFVMHSFVQSELGRGCPL